LVENARFSRAYTLNGRFLIDECLSVGLVAVAKELGFQADYVAYLGKSGWPDWNLISFALQNNYIFVTNNRRDFLREYAKVDLHNGLIVIVADTKRTDQQRLFVKVLDVVTEPNDDLVNKLIEVLVDGSVHVRDGKAKITTLDIFRILNGADSCQMSGDRIWA
jgi:predicted nuclease of predicted toxin-antitoxin system